MNDQHPLIPTCLLRVDPQQPDARIIRYAGLLLRRGKLVAFPTETVYGLGADATDARAVERIFIAKSRPSSDPLIVHIDTFERLHQVAINIPSLAAELAEKLWPGPLTLVLQRHDNIPANVSAGRDTVAVRMPVHAIARALIASADVPIAAPSANTFSRPSSTTAAHVLEDLSGKIELILDGGSAVIGVESTVIDFTTETPTLLRPGGVALETLRDHLPNVKIRQQFLSDTTAAEAPGQLLKHYSPRAKMIVFEGERQAVLRAMNQQLEHLTAQGDKVGILAVQEDMDTLHADIKIGLGSEADLEQVAASLFAAIREIDQQAVSVILVRSFENRGIGMALRDRLTRASEGRVITVTSETE